VKSEGKIQLDRYRRTCENHNKVDVREIGLKEKRDLLALDRDQWRDHPFFTFISIHSINTGV
jgi:hypothetical protein